MELIAQVIGLFAMAFNILSYQRKTRMGVIGFQLFGSALFAVNFFLLGATVGALLNVLSAIRAIVFLNKEKLRADHPLWLAGFTATFLASYVLTFTLFGKGIPEVNNPRRRGSHRFTVVVETPTRLTKEQRELLRQLEETMEETPKRKKFFKILKDLFD